MNERGTRMASEKAVEVLLDYIKCQGFKVVGEGKESQSVLVELPYSQSFSTCKCCDGQGMCWNHPHTISGVDIVEVKLTLSDVGDFLGY